MAAKPNPALPGTRCDEGGKEILVGVVPVQSGDVINLHLFLCRAAFRVVVFLDGEQLADQTAEDDFDFWSHPWRLDSITYTGPISPSEPNGRRGAKSPSTALCALSPAQGRGQHLLPVEQTSLTFQVLS